jgi:hypothetical protein
MVELQLVSPTATSIRYILERPRENELVAYDHTGKTFQQCVDVLVPHFMKVMHAEVWLQDGAPAWFRSVELVPGLPWCLYFAFGTPKARSMMIHHTREGKKFIRQFAELFPTFEHVATAHPGSISVRWLPLLGFVEQKMIEIEGAPHHLFFWRDK